MSTVLEDIEQIKRLKYRYCRGIDSADIDLLTSLFTEDASVLYVGGSYRFEAEGRSQILEALSQAFHSEAVALHNVHHPEIELTSETTASGIWYLKDWFCDLRHQIITDGSALYRDLYVKRDGQWLIQRATYERIFEIVTPFTEPPNLTAHLLGRQGRVLPPN